MQNSTVSKSVCVSHLWASRQRSVCNFIHPVFCHLNIPLSACFHICSEAGVHSHLCWFTSAAADVAVGCIGFTPNAWTHTDARHIPLTREWQNVEGPHESAGMHYTGIWTWGTVLNLGDVIPYHTPFPAPHLTPFYAHTTIRVCTNAQCSLCWACTPASSHSPTNWYLLKAASSKASLHRSNSTGEPGGNKTSDPHGSIHMHRLEKMRHFKSLSLSVMSPFCPLI